MPNLFQQFLQLIPHPALMVGTITAVQGDVAIISLPGGGTVPARGAGSLGIGSVVFVRNGVIEGQAPALVVEVIEI